VWPGLIAAGGTLRSASEHREVDWWLPMDTTKTVRTHYVTTSKYVIDDQRARLQMTQETTLRRESDSRIKEIAKSK